MLTIENLKDMKITSIHETEGCKVHFRYDGEEYLFLKGYSDYEPLARLYLKGEDGVEKIASEFSSRKELLVKIKPYVSTPNNHLTTKYALVDTLVKHKLVELSEPLSRLFWTHYKETDVC